MDVVLVDSDATFIILGNLSSLIIGDILFLLLKNIENFLDFSEIPIFGLDSIFDGRFIVIFDLLFVLKDRL